MTRRHIHSRGGQSVRWAGLLLFVSFSGVGKMSEEWDEVIHEVRLMVERLDAFHDDLKAARNSGALTEPQKKFVDLITEQAYDMAATGCLCGGVCEAQG